MQPLGYSESAKKFAKWLKIFQGKEETAAEQLRREELQLDTGILTERLRSQIFRNKWPEASPASELLLHLDSENRHAHAA